MAIEPVVMRATNLKDVSATLRKIADDIDLNEFGDVLACVVVLDAFRVQTFYCGDGEAGPNAHLLLGLGQLKFEQAVLDMKEG